MTASSDLGAHVVEVLESSGPILGFQVWEKVGRPDFYQLWREAQNNPKVLHSHFDHHYLRIDRKDNGRPRLSPSILRSFLTYTVLSLESQARAADDLVAARRAYHTEVSAYKRALALNLVNNFLTPDILARVSVLVCGDIVRNMAHSIPRQEMSSGERVNGSDLDLVIIMTKPDDTLHAAIEDALMKGKSLYLRSPEIREEVDFKVRPIAEYIELAQMQTVISQVAIKVLLEAEHLAGITQPWLMSLQIASQFDCMRKINALTEKAISDRLNAIDKLRKGERPQKAASHAKLFYFSEEYWEFDV